jgi:hypothetical protein
LRAPITENRFFVCYMPLVKRVLHFAVHTQLQLLERPIAETHRPRIPKSIKPIRLSLG